MEQAGAGAVAFLPMTSPAAAADDDDDYFKKLGQVKPGGRSSQKPTVGDRVRLSADYQRHGDASGGPLKPGDVGEIVSNDGSTVPFKVHFDSRDWWYAEGALQVHAPAPASASTPPPVVAGGRTKVLEASECAALGGVVGWEIAELNGFHASNGAEIAECSVEDLTAQFRMVAALATAASPLRVTFELPRTVTCARDLAVQRVKFSARLAKNTGGPLSRSCMIFK